MLRITPLLGWIGFLFGMITAITAPMYGYAKVTFLCMVPGFLLSSLYIMFSSKLQLKSRWINPGYMGVLLSSAPILIALYYYLFK